MKKLFSMLLIGSFAIISIVAEAAWVVNPSPTMVDTVIDVKVSAQLYLNIFYRLSDGTPHVTFGFVAPADFDSTPTHQDPCQLWDVNLSNGVSRVRNIAKGFPPIYPTLTTSNTLAIGTVDPARMVIYDPVAGTTNLIKNGADRDYQRSVNGTDGKVYFGTYNDAMVEEYDPATNAAKEWGKLDDALSVAAYSWTVGADDGYIYGSIRENVTPFNWYLGIIRKSDTNKTVLWKTGIQTEVSVRLGTNGFWYAYQLTNSISRYWLLTNEVPVLQGSTPILHPLNKNGTVNNDPETWASEEGWDILPSFDVTSVSGSVPTATLGYKQTNDVTYSSVTETNGWLTWYGQMDTLQPWTGTSLLWVVNGYGPVGSFVPFGLSSIIGPYKGVSVYSALQVSASQVYLSGYHGITMRWDPTLPWTRVPVMPDYGLTNINPYNIPSSWGKYHYYNAVASNGKVYIASHHERGTTGGELSWYDPASNTSGTERTTFLSYDVRDLKPAESASKMVYVSTDAKVFVWDVATFTQITNFTVMNSMTLDKVIEYENGKLFAVAGATVGSFTTSGALIYSNSIPSTAWGGTTEIETSRHRLTLGPDNYVWLCAGGSLLRINPADGSSTNILTTTNNYNTVFDGGDCYLYGTKEVWKIASLLSETVRATIAGKASIGRGSF